MEISKKLVIPPKEILEPAIGKSWEHIILWMLAKNEYCEWSDFIDSVSIPLSSLSNNLNSLREDGYIIKPERNQYEITQEGIERLRELEYLRKHGKRALNYPPNPITRKRNYDHWILWMLYNNDYCKWSDFTTDPLSINSSSLSNTLNSLKKSGSIINENSEYRITPEGESEYFEMLKQYDLDRQSILDEESRRLEEITRHTNNFFIKYEVNDEHVKFRFLNNILKLTYSKVENLLNDEEDFNKIILYLSLSHPDSFPEYISIEKFANNYDIKRTTLEFFLEKIVEEEFYGIKFHKLEVLPDKEYYFRANGKIERVLRAIVDEKITRFTYFNKLQESRNKRDNYIKIDSVFEEILNEVCINCFDEGLRSALRSFLPEYIKYLAYQIESTTNLNSTDAKLDSIVLQSAVADLKNYSVTTKKNESGEIEYYYNLDNYMFEILDGYYMDKLMLLKNKEFTERYGLKDLKIYSEFVKGIKKQSEFDRLKELIKSAEEDLEEIQDLILKDILYTYQKDFESALKSSRIIIDKYPDKAIGYLLQSLTHFSSGSYSEALESLEDFEESDDIFITCQKAQILCKMSRHKQANELIDEMLDKFPEDLFLIRTKLVINIQKNSCCVENPELLFELVEKGLDISPKNLDLNLLKVIVYCINENYMEAKQYLDKELRQYYYQENYPSVGTSSLFMRAFSYTARGKYKKAMKDAKKTMVHYEDHYTAFATKALVLGYNLIFNFEPEEQNIEIFNELINKAIIAAPNKAIKARLLSFEASVFHEIGNMMEALKAIDNALMLTPEVIGLYHNKVYFLYSSQRTMEAIDLIDYIIEQFEESKFKMMQTKSVVYYQMKDFETALKTNSDILNEFPRQEYEKQYPSILNNRALILAELGRKYEAIETAKEMIELDKKDGNLRDSFGEVLFLIGEYEDAIKQFEEAIEISPKGWFLDQTYIKMGLCYLKLNLFEEAQEKLTIGKELFEKKPPKMRTAFDHDPDKYLMQLKEKLKN